MVWGFLKKAAKGVATGNAQAQLGVQSPHMASAVVRVGRFLYVSSGLWITVVLYTGYVNMRTQPGSGPSLVMPGAKVIGPPDRPDKGPGGYWGGGGTWFPTAAASPGGKGKGTGGVATVKGGKLAGAKADYPLTLGRTDQGVDFSGAGPIGALADGKVIFAGGWHGWPGNDGIVYSTSIGNIYIMEGVTRTKNPATGRPWAVGDTFKKGTIIAHAFGGPNGIESGYANAQGTGPLTPYNGAQDGTAMPGGLLFRKLLGYN